MLDPTVTFLNHGSYGATPRPVLEAQAAWRAQMEAEPVRFFVRDLGPAMDAARATLAACWVRRERQGPIRPLAVSHGANSPRTDRSRFRLEFDWTGTADPSALRAVPAALGFGARLMAGGWPALRERNRELAIAARDLVCRGLDVTSPTPDELIGSMASVPLPPRLPDAVARSIDVYGDPVHDALAEGGVQAMISSWPQRPDGGSWQRMLRVSAAAYNGLGDMERLADALPGVLASLA